MQKLQHPAEKFLETVLYKGVEFDVVERPDVLWVGCVDYAKNNTDESDIGATLKRFQGLVKEIADETRQLMCPDWSAAISINYSRGDKPNGLMFANETWSAEQDARFDVFTQPGGLWLRVRAETKAATALFGKEQAEMWEYFAGPQAPLQCVAKANGYARNPDVHVVVEYHCHAEYATPPHTSYAYIPIVRT